MRKADHVPVETEIKLVASGEMIEALRSLPEFDGEEARTRLVTTYFDTDEVDLRRAGLSLRVREAGERREQTLKQCGADGGTSVRRREWTVPLHGPAPTLSRFPAAARSLLNRVVRGRPLREVASTIIDRSARRLAIGGSRVEIAFDVGTIAGCGRERTVQEIELELVEGRLADLLRFVRRLPLGPDLRWSVLSKSEQSYLVARDAQPGVERAGAVRLVPAMDAATAFQAIAWSCLGQLLANYPQVIAAGAPEAVHQSRVAIRRLRAAFSLFKTIIDDPETPVLRAGLKSVAAALGEARDLHVLADHVEIAAGKAGQDAAELLAHLRRRCSRATRSAQAVLGSASFQQLLFQVAAWIEGGAWLHRAGASGGDRPIAAVAGDILAKRRRRLRVRRKLAKMTAERRHALRISAKKLRYGTEFVAALFAGGEAGRARRAFAKDLGRLQDALGLLNDMDVADAAAPGLFAGLDPILAARLEAQLADLLASRARSRRDALKSAQRALDRISKASCWWDAAPDSAG